MSKYDGMGFCFIVKVVVSRTYVILSTLSKMLGKIQLLIQLLISFFYWWMWMSCLMLLLVCMILIWCYLSRRNHKKIQKSSYHFWMSWKNCLMKTIGEWIYSAAFLVTSEHKPGLSIFSWRFALFIFEFTDFKYYE